MSAARFEKYDPLAGWREGRGRNAHKKDFRRPMFKAYLRKYSPLPPSPLAPYIPYDRTVRPSLMPILVPRAKKLGLGASIIRTGF